MCNLSDWCSSSGHESRTPVLKWLKCELKSGVEISVLSEVIQKLSEVIQISCPRFVRQFLAAGRV